MRILLTGASSFVGHHVAAHLLSVGHSLIATYRTPNARIEKLRAGAAQRDLVLAQLNIAMPYGYSTLPSELDVVVHIAGATTATGISTEEMLACNVIGTNNLLNYALTSRPKLLIYVSTLSIYGKISGPVVDENTPVMDPDPYGASKYLAERLLATSADNLTSIAICAPGSWPRCTSGLAAGASGASTRRAQHRDLKSRCCIQQRGPRGRFSPLY